MAEDTDRDAHRGEEFDLPSGWTVWSDERTKVVLAFRPDVFDSSAYPAPCLPTIYVSRGERDRRPGPNRGGPDADWYVRLFLEPDVSTDRERYETRAAAIAGATDLADRFVHGDVDYRSLYQVPREDYFRRLDELTR